MSRGREKKYSHMVCKNCGKQNYDIWETRCNLLEFKLGFRDSGTAGFQGRLAEVKFICKDCGFEYEI